MKNNTKKTLKYYWQAVLNYKFSALLIFFSVIGASVLRVITPVYLKKFIDVLASGGDLDSVVTNLFRLLVIIALIKSASWAAWRFVTFATSYFQPKAMASLTSKSFDYLHKHSFAFFENSFVGSLVKRVKWFERAFEVIADQVTWRILPLVTQLILIIIILYQQNYILGISVLIWVFVFLLINIIFSKYKLKYDIKKAEKETETTGRLADTITNSKNIKLFNGFVRESNAFKRILEELRKLRRFTWDLNNFFESFQGLLFLFLEVGILYLAIRLWQKKVLSVGDFVLIQSYLAILFMQLWDFGKILRRIYESLADAEEMTVILDTPHEIADIKGAKVLLAPEGAIEFKNIDFYYRKTREIFKGFNLKIKSNERLALVGPSGSGKTTVVKLLLRMHNVSRGEILVDGQDVSKVTQESLWRKISLVPQDPILFHRSLRENIRYGKPGASNTEIVKAAKAAHAHEFITEFAEGYDTYVGERGIKLSGGERQRVAIARAILRNAPILVLDEATSSLDSESEKLIQEAIDRLMEKKTVIVIAHRLSTIRKMDRIIVIEKGKIIEEGSHQELVEKARGKYKKLWEIQAGNFIE